MRLFGQQQSRQEYFETQIRRSQAKYRYCKVSVNDVFRYREILEGQDAPSSGVAVLGPILCLGTRNGRETDLFRQVFFGPRLLSWILKHSERREYGFASRWPGLEGVARSNWRSLMPNSVIGAEINPMGGRSDIWIGSFDEMPPDWSQKFSIVYSNAFDQSSDPVRTALEWRRVLHQGGYLIFCYSSDVEPSLHDPVGAIEEQDVISLFGGTVIYSARKSSAAGYNEIILKI